MVLWQGGKVDGNPELGLLSYQFFQGSLSQTNIHNKTKTYITRQRQTKGLSNSSSKFQKSRVFLPSSDLFNPFNLREIPSNKVLSITKEGHQKPRRIHKTSKEATIHQKRPKTSEELTRPQERTQDIQGGQEIGRR